VSINHIVDTGYVVIEPIRDPLEQPTWLPAASDDMLATGTPIIGPLATLIVHRIATYFIAGDDWHQFELDELGHTFAVSKTGPNSPLVGTLDRIDRFGFGQLDAQRPKLRIRPMIPPLSRRHAERLPHYLQETCPYITR
jgi:hypothetical protein